MRQVPKSAGRTTVRNIPRPPPTGGWNSRDNPSILPESDCAYLENLLPRPAELSLRGGAVAWRSAAPKPIKTLMPYNSATSNSLFAATDDGIYDVTATGLTFPTVASAATNGAWQYVNMATSAGQFLCAVNGTDIYRYYNGSAWTTVATFVLGAGTIATSLFANINIFQSRVFFVPRNELAFYFLSGAGTVFGTVLRFGLDQVFSKGGSLVAMGTWSVDGSGTPQEYAAFISSEGQVAFYQGTDPADITKWSLVGTYDIGRPMGRRCFCKYGSDLLVLTDAGLFPLSKAIVSASISRQVTITTKIDPTFTEACRVAPAAYGWSIVNDASDQCLIVTVPDAIKYQFVMENQSKGWCKFTGWAANCQTMFLGKYYFADDTAVQIGFRGQSDLAESIKFRITFSQNYFGNANRKQVNLIRPYIQISNQVTLKLSTIRLRDGALLGYFYTIAGVAANALWNVALWGIGLWTSTNVTDRSWRALISEPDDVVQLDIQGSTDRSTFTLATIEYIVRSGRPQ